MDLHVDVGLSTRFRVPRRDEIPQLPDDGYPAVIADQRAAFGCDTVEEIAKVWVEALALKGLEPFVDRSKTAVPYINRARWLVDCPDCGVGNYAWDRNPSVCCLDCGLVFKPAWLAPQVRSAAIRLLAVRPIVNCNWNAHLGETVEELDRENRWLLNDPGIEKNGLVVPASLSVPDDLAVA